MSSFNLWQYLSKQATTHTERNSGLEHQSPHVTQLRQIPANSFQKHYIPNDGDCLLRAALMGHNNTPGVLAENSQVIELRNNLADVVNTHREQLSQHPAISSLSGGIDTLRHLLISPGAWNEDAGDLVPLLLAQLLNKEIHILQPNAKDNHYSELSRLSPNNGLFPAQTIAPLTEQQAQTSPIYLARIDNNHYEFLEPQTPHTLAPTKPTTEPQAPINALETNIQSRLKKICILLKTPKTKTTLRAIQQLETQLERLPKNVKETHTMLSAYIETKQLSAATLNKMQQPVAALNKLKELLDTLNNTGDMVMPSGFLAQNKEKHTLETYQNCAKILKQTGAYKKAFEQLEKAYYPSPQKPQEYRHNVDVATMAESLAQKAGVDYKTVHNNKVQHQQKQLHQQPLSKRRHFRELKLAIDHLATKTHHLHSLQLNNKLRPVNMHAHQIPSIANIIAKMVAAETDKTLSAQDISKPGLDIKIITEVKDYLTNAIKTLLYDSMDDSPNVELVKQKVETVMPFALAGTMYQTFDNIREKLTGLDLKQSVEFTEHTIKQLFTIMPSQQDTLNFLSLLIGDTKQRKQALSVTQANTHKLTHALSKAVLTNTTTKEHNHRQHSLSVEVNEHINHGKKSLAKKNDKQALAYFQQAEKLYNAASAHTQMQADMKKHIADIHNQSGLALLNMDLNELAEGRFNKIIDTHKQQQNSSTAWRMIGHFFNESVEAIDTSPETLGQAYKGLAETTLQSIKYIPSREEAAIKKVQRQVIELYKKAIIQAPKNHKDLEHNIEILTINQYLTQQNNTNPAETASLTHALKEAQQQCQRLYGKPSKIPSHSHNSTEKPHLIISLLKNKIVKEEEANIFTTFTTFLDELLLNQDTSAYRKKIKPAYYKYLSAKKVANTLHELAKDPLLRAVLDNRIGTKNGAIVTDLISFAVDLAKVTQAQGKKGLSEFTLEMAKYTKDQIVNNLPTSEQIQQGIVQTSTIGITGGLSTVIISAEIAAVVSYDIAEKVYQGLPKQQQILQNIGQFAQQSAYNTSEAVYAAGSAVINSLPTQIQELYKPSAQLTINTLNKIWQGLPQIRPKA